MQLRRRRGVLARHWSHHLFLALLSFFGRSASLPSIELAALSFSAAKLEAYGKDPHFREALDAIREIWGAEAERRIHNTTSLILRPDAFAAGCSDTVLRLIRSHFRIVRSRRFWFNRWSVRDVWRYEL